MSKGPIPFRPSMAERIKSKCDEIAEMLIAKNAAYGDSATNPVRIFSRASTTEQLKVRMDDKLSRLARGHAAGEDTNRDLIGYGVLLLIAEEDEAALRAAPCEVGDVDLHPKVATFREDDGSTTRAWGARGRVVPSVPEQKKKTAKKGRAR